MNKEKKVDESWKEQASAEKEIIGNEPKGLADTDKIITNVPVDELSDETQDQAQATEGVGEQQGSIEINFLNYVTSLGFQAMIFMGEIPNPVTKETDKNMEQAKFLIDTLDMLKEKTEGNLSDKESDFMKNSIYELQMKYVQVTQQDSKTDGERKS